LNETDSICYEDREFIIETKKEETLDEEYMKGDVQVQEHHRASDIRRSNNFLDSMNQEVEVGYCQQYVNEVHNEGMLISNNNVGTFTKGTDIEDIQAPVQAYEESKILENNFSKGLFGEKNGMEWNEDLNPGGLGMELES